MGRNSRWASMMLCGGLVVCLVILPMKTRAEVDSQQQTAWPELAGENSGRVVDRQGHPVAAATVTLIADGVGKFQGTSDDEGSFPMPQTHGGGKWLFASKEGFRFRGGFFENAEEFEIVLTSDSDPPPRVLKTLDPVLSHEERLALAADLYLPVVDEILRSDREDNGRRTIRALTALAPIDAGLTLELLEEHPILDRRTQDHIRRKVTVALFADSPEEALAIVESMNAPLERVYSLVELFKMVPAERKAQQQELAAQIVLHARTVEEPPFRLLAYVLALPCLREAGLDNQVKELMDQGRLLAGQLPEIGRLQIIPRSLFAVELALDDLDAALQLLAGLDDAQDYAHYHGNVADRLASVRPDAAQRVWDMIPQEPDQFNFRDHYAIRVCYVMAKVDRQRALDIASTTSGYQRGQVFGALAGALPEQAPEQAEQMLHTAFEALEDYVRQDQQHGSVATIAAGLLPVAEGIDPGLVEEFMWRAISLMPPWGMPDDERLDEVNVGRRTSLARNVARYDRRLARKLVTPPQKTQRDVVIGRIIATAAMIDPPLAVQWLETLPDVQQEEARRAVAEALVRDDDSLQGQQWWKEPDLYPW